MLVYRYDTHGIDDIIIDLWEFNKNEMYPLRALVLPLTGHSGVRITGYRHSHKLKGGISRKDFPERAVTLFREMMQKLADTGEIKITDGAKDMDNFLLVKKLKTIEEWMDGTSG